MNASKKVLSVAFAAVLAGGAGLGTAGVAAASSVPSAVSAQTQASEVTITIKDFEFNISGGSVAPGATVTVVNEDAEVHTVTSTDGAFDSGPVPGGSTATFTAPSEPGDYAISCNFHATMSGTLKVEGASSETGPDSSASEQAPAAAPTEEETSQMGQVPQGGADTGAAQDVGADFGIIALGGGLVLAAAAGGTYVVSRRRS